MNTRARHPMMRPAEILRTAIVMLLPVVLLACASSGPPAEPKLERVGSQLIRYTGPELEVLVSYSFANANLGEHWLMLGVTMSAGTQGAREVTRGSIFVRTPAGERIALPTQQELLAAYSGAGSVIRRAEIATQPLGYMRGDRRRCLIPFFVTPQLQLRGYTVSDSFYVTARQLCGGPLYFPVEGGVQAGGWLLEIEREEGVIRIPFVLDHPGPA